MSLWEGVIWDKWRVMESWHYLGILLPSRVSSLCYTILLFPLFLVQQASCPNPSQLTFPSPRRTGTKWLMTAFTLGPGRVNTGLTLVLWLTTFFKIIYNFQDEALHWCFLTKQILPFMQEKTLATKLASLQKKEIHLEANAVNSVER